MAFCEQGARSRTRNDGGCAGFVGWDRGNHRRQLAHSRRRRTRARDGRSRWDHSYTGRAWDRRGAKILLYEGLEDQFPRTLNPFDDETEDLVSRVENRLFPNAAAILRTLALPELTDGDRQSLFYRVRDFRVEVQNLRQDYGTNLVNSILEALGWTDSDGDGLPDWLEDKLRERGIDPDKPIWTPPPGGGGNPQPVDDPPLPGDGEPTVEPVPEVVPADPNG